MPASPWPASMRSDSQQAAQMAGRLLLERRILAPAALGRVGAARREGAADDRLARATAPCRGSRRAACAGRPARGAEPRHRSRAGRACRDGAGARTSASTGASSTLRPAYITTTRCAISATTPRSCVISTIAAPVSLLELAHQVEDLRLDGDVERGGRLVGDQEPAGRRRAPSRSSPAGACRRRAGAGTARRGARAPGCRTSCSISTARAIAVAARRARGAASASRRSGGRSSAPG